MATITGTSFNDIITEDDLTSGITGGIPSLLPDQIDAQAGNDLVDGAGGNDTVNGGLGDDTLLGGEGNDLLDNDLFNAQGNDSLVGGAGDDTFFAYQNDTIDGGVGNDLIRVWSDQAYSLQGGEGTDIVFLSSSSWFIGTNFSLAGNGIEVIQANGGWIYGGNTNNQLNFSGITLNRVASIDLQEGNDTLTGLGAAMDVRGGGGSDSIQGSSGHDTLYGGVGEDTLIGGEGNDSIDADFFNATGGDSILGGGGNDTILAYQNDTIDGGTGDDLIRVWSDQAYQLQGGDGLDTVSIISSSWLIGTAFNLLANGIEIIEANGEEIYGGNANNNLDFSGIALNRVQYIELQQGNDTVTGLSVAMDVRGGDGNDSIAGSANNDSVYGGWGDDTLFGGEGNDILDNDFNGGGNDSLNGGAGNDTLFAYQNDTIDAGDGDDVIRVWNDQAYQLQGGTGSDTVSIVSSSWVIATSFSLAANGIEIIEGNGEEIYGGLASNLLNLSGITLNRVAFLDLQEGNDTISGLGVAMDVRGGLGNDSIEGSSGSDFLYGGGNDDTLIGGAGNDILDNDPSSSGNDSLFGGAGNDTLFAYQNDTIDGGDGNDLIRVWNDQAYQLQGGLGIDTVSFASSHWVISNTFNLASNGIEIIDGNGEEIYGGSGSNSLDFAGITLNRVPFIDLQEGNDTVTGLVGAMDVRGGNGNDSLAGSIRNDSLYGGSNDDTLIGGAGNDILDNDSSSAGSDSLSGGAGNDTLFAYQNDTVDGGDGNDLIRVWNDQAYQLQGGLGIDTVSFASSHWVISNTFNFAVNGIEIIDGNYEEIYGGSGSNSLDFAGITLNRVAFIDLQDGNDTVTGLGVAMDVRGGNGNDSLIGSSRNDFLYGGANDDILLGGEGHDVVDSDTSNGWGNDSLVGGGGNDTLFAYGNDTIDAGAGNDLIRVWSDQAYVLQGGSGTDTVSLASSYWIISTTFSRVANGIEIIEGNGEEIYGGSVNNDLNLSGITLNRVAFIDLQEGNDTLGGLVGAMDVRGGNGNDFITGSSGSDSLYGGANDDILVAGEGNDILDGDTSNGFGSDSLVGGGGNDTLFAYGNDTIDAGAGNDLIRVWSDQAYSLLGGSGTDTVSLASSFWIISSSFSQANNLIEVIEGNNEEIYSGAGNDVINFSGIALNRVQFIDLQDGNDSVIGSSSADDLRGGGGDDTLVGGGGDDTLRGQHGVDSFDGGDGSDTLDFSFSGAGGSIVLPSGTTALGGVNETFNSIENVIGTSGNDTIIGSIDNNRLEGIWGNDSLRGGVGQDTLSGGFGLDTLDGGEGDDTLDFTYLLASGQVVIDLRLSTASLSGTETGVESVLFFENVIAGQGNDSVVGTGAANRLEGFDGDDTLAGEGGIDTLIGGLGMDMINGGDGIDTVDYRYSNRLLLGGVINLSTGVANMGGTDQDTLTNVEWVIGSEGRDTIVGSLAANQLDGQRSNDSIRGEAGNDTLQGGLGNDTLDGGSDNDSVQGGNGNDLIFGGEGNDTLHGNVGVDTLQGGMGNDLFIFDGSPDTFIELAEEGLDLIQATASVTLSSNIENATLAGISAIDATGNELNNLLIGNAAANRLSGLNGSDTLKGVGGNDTLEGGGGNDTLDGGGDSDTAAYAGAASAVTVRLNTAASQNTGGAGMDTLISIENLTGSAFNDTLTGNSANNVLSGAQGNDTLDGGAGDDTLDGGGELDTVTYAAATMAVTVSLAAVGSQITGGAGTDTLIAIENLTGSSQGDVLTGSTESNILRGGMGNDTLDGGAGNDTLDGGADADTASYATASSSVTVRLNTAAAQNTGGAGTDTLLLVENLIGSTFADTLTGSAGANALSGGLGNDTLDGGAGDDTLDGGADVDTASYATATTAVTVSLALAGSQNTVAAGIDSLVSIENLTGSAHADLLTGNADNNTLSGGGGEDTLEGGGGEDSLSGGSGLDTATYASAAAAVTVNLSIPLAQNTFGAGTDTLTSIENLTGSGFADILTGNTAANLLSGGQGNDTLTGGAGADGFKFFAPTDGVDILTDFLPGTDRIEVVASAFASLPLGALTPSQLITGTPMTTDPVFLYNTTTGALSFDADGTGADPAQTFATLSSPLPTLTASSLVVVGA